MLTVKKVLKNGVKVYELETENDFHEAEHIFSYASVLENISVYDCYEQRVNSGNQFLGIYQCNVDRNDDYNRFLEMMIDEQNHFHRDNARKRNKVRNEFYMRGIVTRQEAYDLLNKLENLLYTAPCTCSICSLRLPTLKEWKTNLYDVDGKRTIKLAKQLRKSGFSQKLIDFYSLQVKTEKNMYIVVSDRVQHIAGMSFYSPNNWNQYGNSSCQDTHHDEHYCQRLAGSLHDNKLYIAFMIENIRDLENMEYKMLSRTMLRLINFDNMPMLISTYYYGNNDNMDMLDKCLSQLVEVGIFPKEYRERNDYDDEVNMTYHREYYNGHYEHVINDEIHVNETIDEYVSVTCPMCDGDQNISRYSYNHDRYVTIECPLCNGTGEYEFNVYEEFDEYVEFEEVRKITPYNEGYDFNYDNNIEIRINTRKIREAVKQHGYGAKPKVNLEKVSNMAKVEIDDDSLPF